MHYPQSSFGGITEYNQICFEKKGIAFPEDWPGTKAGDEEGERRGKEVKEKWQRRPDGKRESWKKILKGLERKEVGDPFKCDWGLLFKKQETEGDAIEKIKNQAKAAMQDENFQATENTHFLIAAGYARQLLSRSSPFVNSADLSNALVPVRLHLLQKGNVSFRARVYRLPLQVEERQKWIDLLKKDGPRPSKGDYPICPTEDDLLGFVTTGNMSLSEGRGRAVGALSCGRVEVEEERWNEEKQFRRWCIVRDVGKDIARLAKWDVND
jgi:ribonuclease P/MRP protein subunit POP1